LALAGCGADDSGDESQSGATGPAAEAISLEGTGWQLVKITAIGGYEFVPEDGSRYNLRFRSENRLTGNSDCNRVGATWRQDGSDLTLEQFSTTNAMCPPGTLHNHFVSNLRNVQGFSASGDRLIFTTTIEGVSLELEPLAAGAGL
jgi:heat shock protein HslJ